MMIRKSDLILLPLFIAAIACCMLWLDRPTAAYFHALDRSAPEWVAPFKQMTDIGKSKWYLPPLAVVMLLSLIMLRLRPEQREQWLRRGQTAGFVFVSVAFSGLLVDLMKILIGRPRPVLLHEGIFNQFSPWIFEARWWSFPSGHAATVMALALAGGTIFPRWRWPLLVCAGLLIGSRVIVAAHYPADVIGGILVAALTHTLLLAWFRRGGWRTSGEQ